MRRHVRQDTSDIPASAPTVYNGRGVSGVLVLARVAVILAAWVAMFIAFLVAPLLVLGLAWLVGLAALALRHRGGHADRGGTVEPGPDTYRFGAAAGSAGDA